MKNKLLSNIVNIPGWSTNKKILIFESDDWGSIRMSSKKDRNELVDWGLNFDNQTFNLYDCIESNDDLSSLYETLCKFKDFKGNHPVFTAVSIVANPDFEKIKASQYYEYHYESFTKTIKRYPKSNKVFELYQKGIKEKLFYPIFHGREHLNVQRWLRMLQMGNETVLKAFNHNVTAIHLGKNNEFIGDFQAAFDLDMPNDIQYMKSVLSEGLDLFENLWGYKSPYFVAPNGPFNHSLEQTLFEKSVKYIYSERIQNEPLGNGHYKRHLRYIGNKNKYGQIYLTRNAFFEPSVLDCNLNVQPVEKCLKSIERAFRWGKPAVISTHRVNYIGSIEEQNRTNNLLKLDILLSKIIKFWPEVEFMTSVELGELILQRKQQ